MPALRPREIRSPLISYNFAPALAVPVAGMRSPHMSISYRNRYSGGVTHSDAGKPLAICARGWPIPVKHAVGGWITFKEAGRLDRMTAYPVPPTDPRVRATVSYGGQSLPAETRWRAAQAKGLGSPPVTVVRVLVSATSRRTVIFAIGQAGAISPRPHRSRAPVGSEREPATPKREFPAGAFSRGFGPAAGPRKTVILASSAGAAWHSSPPKDQ
jgi:hypothetical protein